MMRFWLFIINFPFGENQCAFYVGRILPDSLEFSKANGWMRSEVSQTLLY